MENIRTGFDRKDGLIARIASFTEDTGKPLTLTNFVEHYELNLQTIYKKAVLLQGYVLWPVNVKILAKN